jgi:hypothetical protein
LDTVFETPSLALSFRGVKKDQVKLRYYTLDYYNEGIRKCLPFVDLGRPDAQSSLASVIRGARHMIFASEKQDEWKKAADRSMDNTRGHDYDRMEINAFRATKLFELKRTDFNLRYSIFGQVFRHFGGKPEGDRCKAMRCAPGVRAWQVRMLGLNATDAGGPYRDVLEKLTVEIHQPVLPLFVPCANARSQNGEGRDRVVPRPLPLKPSERALRISAYEFLGRLMGMAMRSGNLLALNFPSLLWKHLVSQPVTQV